MRNYNILNHLVESNTEPMSETLAFILCGNGDQDISILLKQPQQCLQLIQLVILQRSNGNFYTHARIDNYIYKR